MSTVKEILNHKGTEIVTIGPDRTVGDAATMLHTRRIGAVLVAEDSGDLLGVLSERDIVRGIALHGCGSLDLPVHALMTRGVVTCRPEDTISELMEQMTDRRIRHIPVVVDGNVCGIVSIGDVVKSRIAEIEFESEAMRRYIVTG